MQHSKSPHTAAWSITACTSSGTLVYSNVGRLDYMYGLQADLTLQSWDLRTPLHVAAHHRQPAIIRELLLDPHVRLQLHQSSTPTAQAQSHHSNPRSGISSHDISANPSHASRVAMNSLIGDAQQQQTAQPHISHPDQDETSAQDEEDGQMQAAADSLNFLQSADLGSLSSLIQPPASSGRGVDGMDGSDALTSHAEEDMLQADADSSLDDADALDALLSLTADCSMQCPREATHKPDPTAGDCILSSSASWTVMSAC